MVQGREDVGQPLTGQRFQCPDPEHRALLQDGPSQAVVQVEGLLGEREQPSAGGVRRGTRVRPVQDRGT